MFLSCQITNLVCFQRLQSVQKFIYKKGHETFPQQHKPELFQSIKYKSIALLLHVRLCGVHKKNQTSLCDVEGSVLWKWKQKFMERAACGRAMDRMETCPPNHFSRYMRRHLQVHHIHWKLQTNTKTSLTQQTRLAAHAMTWKSGREQITRESPLEDEYTNCSILQHNGVCRGRRSVVQSL